MWNDILEKLVQYSAQRESLPDSLPAILWTIPSQKPRTPLIGQWMFWDMNFGNCVPPWKAKSLSRILWSEPTSVWSWPLKLASPSAFPYRFLQNLESRQLSLIVCPAWSKRRGAPNSKWRWAGQRPLTRSGWVNCLLSRWHDAISWTLCSLF